MAIANVDIVYSGQGPSASGQVFADGVMPGPASSNIDFSGTATLDGAATTFLINLVPGTAGAGTLPYTPSGVLISRVVRSTDTGLNTITAQAGGAANISASQAGVTLSAAGTAAQTVSFVGRIIR